MPRPPLSAEPSERLPGFARRGDYEDRFLTDALAALPKAPLRVVECVYWYVTGRGVRARNRIQEVVGRHLGFARPNRLRPRPAPAPPAERPSLAALVPVPNGTPPAALAATLATIPAGVEPILASAQPLPSDLPGRRVAAPAGASLADLVNAAAAASDHEIVLVVLPGNALLRGAPDAIAAAFARAGTLAAYADEALALPGRTLPLLKPDFDEDLLAQVDYIGEFLAVRRDTFLSLGGYRGTPHEGAARDLVRRLCEARGGEAIAHIEGPIHGRDLRMPDARMPADGRTETRRALPNPPPVSVIVPTRDRLDLLIPCLDGLLRRTDYPDLEIIVADNDSREPETRARLDAYAADPRLRVVRMPGPFNFSRINNEAVALARGQVIVCMNNDVEVLEPGWLRALVAEAVRPEVGAVGAKLLYPDGLVQHAGVVVGLMGGPAGHAFHLFRDGHPGYLHMLETTRRCSAVTAACLAIGRDKFEAMGGFDAQAFPVALNDVDLCLRLDAAGYRNLYVPAACLLHKESASRPADMQPDQRARYERELAAFGSRWPERLARDPWYNRGHGYANADFSVPHWTDPDWPPPR